MGYHVITLNTKKQKLEYTYIESIFKLIEIKNITEDSFIIQGEENWKPVRVGDDKQYSNYTKDWFRSGVKAQELFKKHAKSEGLILEEINQDILSFDQYSLEKHAKDKEIKRGDFLIRNRNNIEVEVKCRSFYEKENTLVFNFKCEDVKRHLNMQKMTNIPILIAVYKRNNDEAEDDIPYFISIDEINSNKTLLNTTNVSGNNTGDCYQIPLTLTSQTFKYIEDINGQKTKSKSFTLEEKRAENENAYKKWTPDNDEQLKELYCKKESITKLSEIFGRNIGAINSRIKQLGLKQKYNLL